VEVSSCGISKSVLKNKSRSLVTVKGFIGFAARVSRRKKMDPEAAKLMKPRSELNPGGLAGRLLYWVLIRFTRKCFGTDNPCPAFGLRGSILKHHGPVVGESVDFCGGASLIVCASEPITNCDDAGVHKHCGTQSIVPQSSRQTAAHGGCKLPRSGLVHCGFWSGRFSPVFGVSGGAVGIEAVDTGESTGAYRQGS